MILLSNFQKNVFLAALIAIFSILILLDGFDGLWSFACLLIIYLFFVIFPVSKNLYFENGTGIQKLILAILFILLTMDIFLALAVQVNSLNGVIITLFLIIFLNYTSTTLQISPKYHPIIGTFNVVNIVIVIAAMISLIVNVIWNSEPYDIYLSYILFIMLIISSFIYDIKYKKEENGYYSIDLIK